VIKKKINIFNLKKKFFNLKKRNKRIVMTNGCFDIIHAGHIKIFKESKKLGDILVVAVNSDRSIKKLKGNSRPFNKIKDRLSVLESIIYIDHILVFNSLTPKNIYQKLKPHIITKGSEYHKSEVVGSLSITKNNGKVILIKMLKNRSTSNLAKKINKYI
jgi:rfaE bifunctional protein nucleotidyltransferase chain/domain